MARTFRFALPMLFILAAATALWQRDVIWAGIQNAIAADIRDTLQASGYVWVDVRMDRLTAELYGTAPDGEVRNAAFLRAQEAHLFGDVIDRMQTGLPGGDDRVPPPDLTIVFDAQQLTVMGYVPQALKEMLVDYAGIYTVTDVSQAVPRMPDHGALLRILPPVLEHLAFGTLRLQQGHISLWAEAASAGALNQARIALQQATGRTPVEVHISIARAARIVPPPPPPAVRAPAATVRARDVQTQPLRAHLSEDGSTVFSGAVADALSLDLIPSISTAHFGVAANVSDVVIVPATGISLPDIVLMLTALSPLRTGTAEIDGRELSVSGDSFNIFIAEDLEARLTPILNGLELNLTVQFVPELEEDLPPDPEICAEEIASQLVQNSIVFAPSSGQIIAESEQVLDDIAAIILDCGDAQFEIAGYTDSRGGEDVNLAISVARAESVLDALMTRGVFRNRLRARGYGEADPIADNETEEGRARNRRIAFRLLPQEIAQ